MSPVLEQNQFHHGSGWVFRVLSQHPQSVSLLALRILHDRGTVKVLDSLETLATET